MAERGRPAPGRILLGGQPHATLFLPDSKASQECLLALACWNYDSASSSLEICALQMPSLSNLEHKRTSLQKIHVWEHQAPVTQMRTLSKADKLALISGSSTGNVTVVVTSNDNTTLLSENTADISSMITHAIHKGYVSAVDVRPDSGDCLTAGEDGKICIFDINQVHASAAMVLHDASNTGSFSAAKWKSSSEFVTASTGCVLQLWDRRTGRPSARCQVNMEAGAALATPSFHSIDVHPSQPHFCAIGGSGGSVLIWDLRFHGRPHVMAVGEDIHERDGGGKWPTSEVWQVKFDTLQHTSNITGSADSRFPPVMACTQNGRLAVADGETVQLLAAVECGISCFDITNDYEGVICGLEDESLLHIQGRGLGTNLARTGWLDS